MEMLMHHMRHPLEHAHTESKGARNNNLFHLAAHSVAAAAAAAEKLDANSHNIMLCEATEEKTEYLYQTQAVGERGGLVHDANAPSVPALDDTLQHTLQQLEAEQSRQMDMFASECAAREVAIRHHRLAARAQLEEECESKVAASNAKLQSSLAKYRPSQNILDLRMKIRALGLSRRAMDYTEKTRLERDLLARESNEKERFRERVRVEHQVVAGRIKLEVERGHTAIYCNTLQHTITHCNTHV